MRNWMRTNKLATAIIFMLIAVIVAMALTWRFGGSSGYEPPEAIPFGSSSSDPSGSTATSGSTSTSTSADPASTGTSADPATRPGAPTATVNTPSGGFSAVNTGSGTIIQAGGNVHIDYGKATEEQVDRLHGMMNPGGEVTLSQGDVAAAVRWWNEHERLRELANKAKAEAEDAQAAGDLAEYNRLMDQFWSYHDERLILDFPFVNGVTVYALRTSSPSLYNDYGKFEFVAIYKWDPYYRSPMTKEQLAARGAFYTHAGDGKPFTWREYLKDVLWPEWTEPTYGVIARFAGSGTEPTDFSGVRYFIRE